MKQDNDNIANEHEATLAPVVHLLPTKMPTTHKYSDALHEAHKQVERASSGIFASMLAVSCSNEWADWDSKQLEGSRVCFSVEDFEGLTDPNVQHLLQLHTALESEASRLRGVILTLSRKQRPSMAAVLGDEHSRFNEIVKLQKDVKK